jgi:DNA polymerase
VRFWGDVEDAALRALYDRTTVKLQYGLAFSCAPGFLFLRLPSGRRLAYFKPRLMPGKFGRDQITYEGVEGSKWKRIPTYGGK